LERARTLVAAISCHRRDADLAAFEMRRVA
jgi:hypothetical protein